MGLDELASSRPERHVRQPPCGEPLPRVGHHGRGELGADDLAGLRGEGEDQGTGPAAHFEDSPRGFDVLGDAIVQPGQQGIEEPSVDSPVVEAAPGGPWHAHGPAVAKRENARISVSVSEP